MLQFMGLQSVGRALVSEQHNKESGLIGEAVDSDTMKDHVEVLGYKAFVSPISLLIERAFMIITKFQPAGSCSCYSKGTG